MVTELSLLVGVVAVWWHHHCRGYFGTATPLSSPRSLNALSCPVLSKKLDTYLQYPSTVPTVHRSLPWPWVRQTPDVRRELHHLHYYRPL